MPLCPSASHKVSPSSCPLRQGCHPAISSSDTLFSFCPQSFPASGTFPMSQLFISNEQTTGVSTSASVLPTSIQGGFPLRLTGLISLLSKGLSGVFSSTTVQRHQFFLAFCLLYNPALTTVCDHWEDHSFNYTDFCWQSNASAFQHTKFVIAFLPRSNRLQISWLQLLSTVILEPKRRKSVTTSTCPPSFAMK